MKNLFSVLNVLARLRVGLQLAGAFGVLLLFTAVLGGVGLLGVSRIEMNAAALASKWLRGVADVAELRAAMLQSRELEKKHGHSYEPAQHAEYEAGMKEAAAAASSLSTRYAGLVKGDEESRLLAAFAAAWAGYQKTQQDVVALGRGGKHQDASDLSEGAAGKAMATALGALDGLARFNAAGAGHAAEDSKRIAQRATNIIAALLATALLLGTVLAALITRRLIRQLGGEPTALIAVARAVAQGDLTTTIDLRDGDSSSLLSQLQMMQHGLSGAVRAVRRGAQTVAHASGEITQGNLDLSSRTEQQASALQQTAATMDELGATVQHTANNAKQANALAVDASTVATRGGQVMGNVVDTMQRINESSRKIAEIVALIDSIAFQTNILALNAAVEAARAGEQGRGFTVVAAEVRTLAQRSAAAAKDIKQLIGGSVERVAQGTKLVDEAGRTMADIVSAIGRVTRIVGEISEASSEQSAGVSQVGQAVSQMDHATQQNSAMVEQSASAARSLQDQAKLLVQAVEVFKVA